MILLLYLLLLLILLLLLLFIVLLLLLLLRSTFPRDESVLACLPLDYTEVEYSRSGTASKPSSSYVDESSMMTVSPPPAPSQERHRTGHRSGGGCGAHRHRNGEDWGCLGVAVGLIGIGMVRTGGIWGWLWGL